MRVKLLYNTPLYIADTSIGKCWDKQKEICDIDRIKRVALKNKHSSTIEHLVYTFDIDGISRLCLMELTRHRIASYSVKSTRYTLKELKNGYTFSNSNYDNMIMDKANRFIVLTGEQEVDFAAILSLSNLQKLLRKGISNDIAKYVLPESYKTSLVMTINARSLQNLLSLRTDKSAHFEIRELSNNMYNIIPDDHKFLFKDFVK